MSIASSQKDYACVEPKKKINHALCTIYEPLEFVKSFKYLDLEVSSKIIYIWNECATRCLEVGKRAYYAFERDLLLVILVVLYGVEICVCVCGTKSLCASNVSSTISFFYSFLHVSSHQTSPSRFLKFPGRRENKTKKRRRLNGK